MGVRGSCRAPPRSDVAEISGCFDGSTKHQAFTPPGRLISVSIMSGAQHEALAAAELVSRAKAGDPKAFDDLVRRYRRRIFACALHLSGSKSEADDITQDVF